MTQQVTPREIYDRWLVALRSGKYKQINGSLRECEYGDYDYEKDQSKVKKVVGYCCLGVLQDLAVKDGGDPWNTRGGKADDDAEPKKEITDFLGLNQEMISHLIEMNDDQHASFREIADEIEGNIMPSLGHF